MPAPDPWYIPKPDATAAIPTVAAKSSKADDDKRAHLEILRPPGLPKIPLCFNPTELQLSKQNTFQEVPIPGLNAPPIQFVRGASEKLTFDAIVDTSDDMTNVRVKYVDPLRKLLAINGDLHAPPVVQFVWESFRFTGVIESLNVTFTLFNDQGQPVRAKLGFALKEYTTVAQQVKLAGNKSPDLEKSYVVKRGDTLDAIAGLAYGDPSQWRAIASANGIVDPRTLAPGVVLTIPRLDGVA